VPWRNRIVRSDVADPTTLLPHPENWRRHPDYQKAALQGVLEEVGVVQDVLVNQTTGHLVDGHLRVALAIETHQPAIPVTYLDLTVDEERLILATLDPLAALAERAAEVQDSLLAQIHSQHSAVQALLDSLRQETQAAMPRGELRDVEPRLDAGEALRAHYGVAWGQLWQLGSHRLLCGDATDGATVQRLMDGARAILFATDPPYGVGYTGMDHPVGSKESEEMRRKKNKDWSTKYTDWDQTDVAPLYQAFVTVALQEAVAPNAAWYCWHASRQQHILAAAWKAAGILFHQQIIWSKTRPVIGHSYYMNAHEPCLFGWQQGHPPPRRGEDYPNTVWHYGQDLSPQARLHPTPKPIELWETPMRQHTLPGEVCYEPFCGSGSQLITGEQLGRRVYALDLSPEFVAVALQRWVDLTGQTPVLLSSCAESA
jgi:DNA modification methylase